MKKLLLYAAITLWASLAISNPIVTPYIQINELYFEEGEWTIELVYDAANQEDYPIVSIQLSTISGETEMMEFEISNGSGFIIVQNNGLLSAPLIVNPEGDVVTVSWGIYFNGSIYFDTNELVFGELPNTSISKPRPGQSISRFAGFYSKDNSPTLGQVNDTTGAMGTLAGRVYDINLQPVPDQTFLLPNWFITSASGDFSTRVFSHNYNISSILHKISQSSYEWLDTEIHYIMEPDSVVNYDIYLLDTLTVGIAEPTGGNAGIFRFYPNPVNCDLSIHYEINLSDNINDLMIEIKTISSLQVYTSPVSKTEGIITLPEQISPGVYLVNLLSGSKVLASGRLIISR
jgi:hypothetical protein